MQPCIICGNVDNNSTFAVPELQLGLKEEFQYQLCGNCRTAQITEIPNDLGKYYPNEDYYSFNLGADVDKKPDALRHAKANYLIHGKQFFPGAFLSIGYKMPDYYQWMKNSDTAFDASILDVGTGNGSLLTKLFRIGYTDLTGIDPFINESRDYGSIKILKKSIYEVNEQFDLVMLHHSLEHMPEPKKALRRVYELVKPGGKAIIRIPIMNNYGWKTYKEYWCGIDAPRHIFIPSEEGLKSMVSEAGFDIDTFHYDSSDYVIWSSEQYKAGIPLHASNSRMMHPKNSIFSKQQIDQFKKTIAEENKKGNGDTAAIYLRKS